MCMQDILIGRSTTSVVDLVTIPAGAQTTLVPADPLRIGMVVCQPGSDSVRVGPNDTASATVGALLTSTGDKPLTADLHVYGLALTWRWTVWNNGAGAVQVLVISTALLAQEAKDLPTPSRLVKGVR